LEQAVRPARGLNNTQYFLLLKKYRLGTNGVPEWNKKWNKKCHFEAGGAKS